MTDRLYVVGVKRDAAIVKIARELKGMTQVQLADKVGVEEPTIRRVERGDPRVKDTTLARVAMALGLHFDWQTGTIQRPENIPPSAIERVLRDRKKSARPPANGHPVRAESGIAPDTFTAATIPEWEIDLRANTWAPVPCASLDTNDPEQAAVIASGRFRLRLAGRCMEPEYSDGQVIEFQIIRIDLEPLEVGRDYCFCRIDDTATFKTLAKINDDDYSLAAINQRDFPGVIVVPKQEICRIAKVLYRLQPPPEPKVPKIKARR